MDAFKAMIPVAALVAMLAAMPGHAEEKPGGDGTVCKTDKNDKVTCFDYRCLPGDEDDKLDTITVNPDPILTSICLAPAKFAARASTRADAVKLLAESCRKGGGKLLDRGSKVTCTLAARPANKQLPKARSRPLPKAAPEPTG